MIVKKLYCIVLWLFSFVCWMGTITLAGYVLIDAIKSMDGTMHGFNGEMLYGMDAFIDTVLVWIVFLYPFFIIWIVCLVGAVTSTVAGCVCYCFKKGEI